MKYTEIEDIDKLPGKYCHRRAGHQEAPYNRKAFGAGTGYENGTAGVLYRHCPGHS